jgi:superfamily II DNA or RNA helicase
VKFAVKFPVKFVTFVLLFFGTIAHAQFESLQNYQGHLEGHATGQKYDRATKSWVPASLKPRQVTMFEKTRSAIASGKKVFYLDAAASSGKTSNYAKVIEAATNFTKVFVLSPTIALVNQSAREVTGFTDIPRNQIGIYHSQSTDRDLNRRIIEITYHSFVKLLNEEKISINESTLLICDEAHLALSDLRKETLQKVITAGTTVIGYTATDEYNEIKQVTNLLHEKIDEISIVDAVYEGLTAPNHVEHIKIDQDVGTAYLGDDRFDENELSKILDQGHIDQLVAEVIQNYLPLTGTPQTLVNVNSIQYAERMAETLRSSGLKAIAIHGGNAFFNAPSNGPQILEDFLKNKADYDVVVNVDMLGIGVSAPELGLVINVSPTYSKVKAIQRVRNNRLSWNNPDKLPITVEFNYINSKREKQGLSPQIFYSDILNGEEIYVGQNSPYESIRRNLTSTRKILMTANQVQIIGVEEIVADRARMSRERWTLDQISDAILNWNIEHQDQEIKDPDTYVKSQEKARLPTLNRLVHLCKKAEISVARYFGSKPMLQEGREHRHNEWSNSSTKEMVANSQEGSDL